MLGCSTEELEGLAHCGLDVNRPEVVPSLLEEGGEEVDTHEDVLSELLLSHLLVADSDGHAGDLLELELDGSAGIIDLGSQVLVVGDDLGEHTNTVEDGSLDVGDLLDEKVTGKEEVFRNSKSTTSTLMFWALTMSMCLASPIRQSLRPGLGMWGRRTVPAKRLSFWGS